MDLATGDWGGEPQLESLWVLCPPGPDDLLFHLQELQGALRLHQARGAETGLLLAKRGGGQVLPRRPPALLQKLPSLRQGLAGPTQQHPLPLHRGPHPGDPARDGAGGLEEIQSVHPKGDQSWYFFGRNDAKAETPVLWPPHEKS